MAQRINVQPTAQEDKKPKTASRPRIGSKHIGQINYGFYSRAFVAEDVPAKAKAAKKFIRAYTTPDIIGRYKKPWNVSTGEGDKVFPQRALQATISKHDFKPEVDYRAERLYKKGNYEPKGNKFTFSLNQHDPNVKLETKWKIDAPKFEENDWNMSVTPDKRAFNAADTEFLRTAVERSASMNEKYTTNRISLMQRQKDHEADFRQLKKEAVMGNTTLKGLLQSRVDVKKEALLPEEELPPPPKPLSQRLHKRERVYHHTGTWEQNQFDSKGRKAWSCCMNGNFDSPGCQGVWRDLDQWNYESFLHSNPNVVY
eukprot:GFYU01005567.1.p1 GENE.GFYU01005567.1~~GFYU01005567.1.p1  ORF type:complete len:313 (-),score=51.11 GFYU01005567.1:97-1035(-)